MKRLFLLTALASGLLISGCKPYQMDIPQGRHLTEIQVEQIKIGMSKESILRLLGSPLQGTPVYNNNNRLDYVATMQKNGGVIHETRLSLYFKSDKLIKIEQKEEIV